MSFIEIIRVPDAVWLEADKGWVQLPRDSGSAFTAGDMAVAANLSGPALRVAITSSSQPVKRVQLRWQGGVASNLQFLGDHWERGYGDLEWRGMVPERIMPWYFLTYDGERTHGYGVKTGAGALCFWQVDAGGLSLILDVRCGGMGVHLRQRTLEAAVVTARQGREGESAYHAARDFCKTLCDKPIMPAQPVYGGNNWYYAYGNSSHDEICDDAKRIASWAPSSDNRPFMVIDDGWQICHHKSCNGGPWSLGNYLFPSMDGLAGEMKENGVRPGIWTRPLLTAEMVPKGWVLTNARFKDKNPDQFLDPSVPEVLEHISRDISRMASWGYEMIKHDFTTYDIFGKWGFEMGGKLTENGWAFADKGKTTAEIIKNLYTTIREAAGDSMLIGCNTIGHLGAGLFEIQRTGDDTSGREWERTRKMGINTLAFRMPQHGTFFASDADCIGLTRAVPWELNCQWLKLLATSGTPLFVSADPKAVGKEQEKALREAFSQASKQMPIGEPVDWLTTTCPKEWLLVGEKVSFEWEGKRGVEPQV